MLLFFLLFSCVSKPAHELIQVQLDATRTALSAKNASCYEGFRDREDQLAQLHVELGQLMAQETALHERNQQLSQEVDALRLRIAELLTMEHTCPPCPDPRKKGPKAVEAAPTVLAPLVQATVDEVQAALAAKSRSDFLEAERQHAHQQIVEAFAPMAAEGRLTVVEVQGRSVVRIPSVQIFNEGRVDVSPRGEVLLELLADALVPFKGRGLEVAAHTDNKAYHTAEHNSAWELGFDQAMTVAWGLRQAGIRAPMSVATHAGTQPLTEDDTPAGRKLNRRIELVFGPLEIVVPEPVEEPPGEPAQGLEPVVPEPGGPDEGHLPGLGAEPDPDGPVPE